MDNNLDKKLTTHNSKPRQISFLDLGDKLIELVGDKNNKWLLEYSVLTEDITTSENIVIDGFTYVPPKDDLVNKGTILLPTFPESFGTLTDLTVDIEAFIYEYLDIPETFRKLAVYYVLLTWLYDCFEVLPYLRAIGDYGTGKTRLQKVIGSICYKPMFANGATTVSPIFRIIDMYHGTLIIDEADFRFSGASTDMIKILNCGYQKGMPVLRTEGDKERMPVSYEVFGPKIIGTRERFQDLALESRCLTEIMSGSKRPNIPLHLPKEFDGEALKLRNKLLAFRLRNYGRVEVDLNKVIPGVENRINQIVLPLLSIIEDPSIQQEIIEFVKVYSQNLKEERGKEQPALIVRAIVDLYKSNQPLQYKLVVDKVSGYNNFGISETAIGKINKAVLNLKTKAIDGLTTFLWDTDKIRVYCDRYNVDFPETGSGLDLTDLIDHPCETKYPAGTVTQLKEGLQGLQGLTKNNEAGEWNSLEKIV